MAGAVAGIPFQEAVELLSSAGADVPALGSVMAPLRRSLDAEAVALFGIDLDAGAPEITFLHGELPWSREALVALVRSKPLDFGLTAAGADPRTRNLVVFLPALAAAPGEVRSPGAASAPAGRCGLRATLADGDEVLGCVVAVRGSPFGESARRTLQRLLAPLRRRLLLDRSLEQAPVAAAALGAVLDALGAPAFVATAQGHVVRTNAEGAAMLAREGGEAAAGLRERIAAGGGRSFVVVPLGASGAGGHYLVVHGPAGPRDLAARADAAAARWALTPRQRDTLTLLAAGRGNRDIAAELGCAERTIEDFVAACLGKAGCGSRAELVAKFWNRM